MYWPKCDPSAIEEHGLVQNVNVTLSIHTLCVGRRQVEKFIHSVCFLVIEPLKDTLERQRTFQKMEPKALENNSLWSNFQEADLI